jgi:iron-sulfur cluster repair protein YtfE (RIC family)
MTEEQKLLCDSLFDLSQCAHSDISIALDAMEVIEEQDAELSRLRGEEQAWKREALNGHEVVQLRDAEIERLRGEVERLTGINEKLNRLRSQEATLCFQLKSEVERLTKELSMVYGISRELQIQIKTERKNVAQSVRELGTVVLFGRKYVVYRNNALADHIEKGEVKK